MRQVCCDRCGYLLEQGVCYKCAFFALIQRGNEFQNTLIQKLTQFVQYQAEKYQQNLDEETNDLLLANAAALIVLEKFCSHCRRVIKKTTQSDIEAVNVILEQVRSEQHKAVVRGYIDLLNSNEFRTKPKKKNRKINEKLASR